MIPSLFWPGDLSEIQSWMNKRRIFACVFSDPVSGKSEAWARNRRRSHRPLPAGAKGYNLGHPGPDGARLSGNNVTIILLLLKVFKPIITGLGHSGVRRAFWAARPLGMVGSGSPALWGQCALPSQLLGRVGEARDRELSFHLSRCSKLLCTPQGE